MICKIYTTTKKAFSTYHHFPKREKAIQKAKVETTINIKKLNLFILITIMKDNHKFLEDKGNVKINNNQFIHLVQNLKLSNCK